MRFLQNHHTMSTRTRARGKTKSTQPSRFNVSDEEDNEERDNEQVSILTDTLNKQLKRQRENITELTKSFDFMSNEFDKLRKVITKLSEENKQIKNDVNRLKTNENKMVRRINLLEATAAKANQTNNQHHMIITNLPKLNNEIELKDVVINIGKEVAVDVKPEQILEVYQNENKKFHTFPIIVKMNNGELKKKCMEYRKLKNEIQLKKIIPDANQIHNKNINFHHLMEKRMSELLAKTKITAKKKKYKFAWFNGMQVLVRKDETSNILTIITEEDLNKLN